LSEHVHFEDSPPEEEGGTKKKLQYESKKKITRKEDGPDFILKKSSYSGVT